MCLHVFVCLGGERSECSDGREGEKLQKFQYLMFLYEVPLKILQLGLSLLLF